MSTQTHNVQTLPSGRGMLRAVMVAMVLAAVATVGTIWLQNRNRPTAAGEDVLPVLYAAPGFAMTDQASSTLNAEDLKGKVWIADFVFVNCKGPCPAMTQRMAKLTREITDPAVRFVSFSVDPANDTPAALEQYAASQAGADLSRWSFLTTPGTNYLDVAQGFRVMAKPADGSQPIIHSEKFFLVDKKGQVRGFYRWADEDSMKQLAADAAELVKE
jgi:protein SCO1